ncbi:ABC transporter permease [Candidatus Parcubacteria bacterium]|nr:MAG: ABC transporter permease [Candidatus Parcubacteria bacterium]
MSSVAFQRIIRSGFNNFKRNSWLTVATITVMFLALFVLQGLLIFSVVTRSVIDSLQDKIDISVYFKKGVPEEEILIVQEKLETLEEVRTVEYISENEALARFKTRHSDNPILLESLAELDQNPLQASLNIKARVPEEFASIASFLDQGEYSNSIEKINYFQNKDVIDRLTRIIGSVERGWIILSIVLSAISVMVAFSAIRLAIYTSREEIGIMRLVGGTPSYVRGPYLVEGALFGLVAAIMTILVFYPVSLFIGPKISSVIPEINLSSYYLTNIFQIGGLLIIVGVGLGMLSSLIAIRRYLKV